MVKGRAPCCDKDQVKKGPWSPAEDMMLVSFIQKHGHENWRALPKQAGLLRCGKSCRLRWINYLRPDIKRGDFTQEEEDTIIGLHKVLGNSWSKIASQLPGRTDNEIKNVWNTHLKKRLAVKDDSSTKIDDSKESSTSTFFSDPSSGDIVQSRKRNPGKEHEIDENSLVPTNMKGFRTQESRRQESNEHEETKKLRKEIPSSSTSLNNSDVPSSCQVFFSIPEELRTVSSSKYHVHSTLEEVNKPEFSEGIQSDYDFDFWNMLDNFTSFQSNADLRLHTLEGGHTSTLVDTYNYGEVKNRNWLRYLENELGDLK